ncbi:hypothetical protein VPHD239_0058 [Vibrio phage D239]
MLERIHRFTYKSNKIYESLLCAVGYIRKS